MSPSSALHSSLDPRQVVLTPLSCYLRFPECYLLFFGDVTCCHLQIPVLLHDVAQMAYLTQAGTRPLPWGRAGASYICC